MLSVIHRWYSENSCLNSIHRFCWKGGASSWSAESMRAEDESKFDALNAAKENRPVLFTGEVGKIAWTFCSIHSWKQNIFGKKSNVTYDWAIWKFSIVVMVSILGVVNLSSLFRCTYWYCLFSLISHCMILLEKNCLYILFFSFSMFSLCRWFSRGCSMKFTLWHHSRKLLISWQRRGTGLRCMTWNHWITIRLAAKISRWSLQIQDLKQLRLWF